MIQLCSACRVHVFYPRQICSHGGGSDLEWIEPSGFGRVYATTTVCLDPARPYEVSLVDLDEGVRLMWRVEGVTPGEVAIGLRVKARVVQENEASLVVFDRVEEEA